MEGNRSLKLGEEVVPDFDFRFGGIEATDFLHVLTWQYQSIGLSVKVALLWLGGVMVVCRTADPEVPGSTPVRCTAR